MMLLSVCLSTVCLIAAAPESLPPRSVPILYTTDLYHPHDDPDDHYDLLSLFAMPEFDILGIVIDTGPKGAGRAAEPALRQMMSLSGREIPYATGLIAPLKAPDDPANDRPEAEEAGVNLLLESLRNSERPVTLFITGSLRDVTAAYNRAPELFREKAARLYVNAGWVGDEMEWNVGLDHHAFVGMMRSGLPLYWGPCFGEKGYQTYWKFPQETVLNDAPPAIQNFFLYMLTQADPAKWDPIEYLHRTPDAEARARFWPQERDMWCTALFLDAAGRSYSGAGFVERYFEVRDDGKTFLTSEGEGIRLNVFQVTDFELYTADMIQTLRALCQVPLSGEAP